MTLRRACLCVTIVVTSACVRTLPPISAADPVTLLNAVVTFSAESLGVGPRVLVARTTKSTPSVPISVETQAALVASSPRLSSVERYETARQVCDTVAGIPEFCHFTDADGLIAILNIRMKQTAADVDIEYYHPLEMVSFGNVDPALNAQVRGKKILVHNVGTVTLVRDSKGRWRVTGFHESGMGGGT
jgi:hypothetical protein